MSTLKSLASLAFFAYAVYVVGSELGAEYGAGAAAVVIAAIALWASAHR